MHIVKHIFCRPYRPIAVLYTARSIGYLTASLFDFSCRGESYTTTRPTDFLSPTPVVWRIARLFRSTAGGVTGGASVQRITRAMAERSNERLERLSARASIKQAAERTARAMHERIACEPAQQSTARIGGRETDAPPNRQTRTARNDSGK